jgi:glucose/mannose-6-phosphate isomerase
MKPLDLSQRAVMKELDPIGMLEWVEGFPDQCREALLIARNTNLRILSHPIQNVVLCGMGGSAAGGDFVKAIFEAQGAVPFSVVREYDLPAYVRPGTLVFVASYSGNTEETLSAYRQAIECGATIAVVSSGGEASRIAQSRGDVVVTVPGGQPPRSALGFMLIPVLSLCEAWGLIPEQPYDVAFASLDAVRRNYGTDTPDNPAMNLAERFYTSVGICYGLGGYRTAIANRWRCQFNENAKYLLFTNGYPELCHNEIMGWVQAGKQAPKFFGVTLTDGKESERMRVRAQVTQDVIGRSLVPFETVRAEGESLLERMLTLAYIGDWVSLYLARLNEVDPVGIANIDALKDALAKVSG